VEQVGGFRRSPSLTLGTLEGSLVDRYACRRKIRHFQGFKTGNLTTFLVDVFTPNSYPIGQTLGMAGLDISTGRNHVITYFDFHAERSPKS
jgi:hypothetical protein